MTADPRRPLAEARARFRPHLSLLAVRHPSHAAAELGADRERAPLWDPSRLEAVEAAYRQRRGLFNETVVLEALVLHRREPLALLRRLGFHPQIAADMVAGCPRPPQVLRAGAACWCCARGPVGVAGGAGAGGSFRSSCSRTAMMPCRSPRATAAPHISAPPLTPPPNCAVV